MKKLIAALALCFLALVPASQPTIALDRTQHLTGLNPPSTWLNMEQRDVRIGFGTLLWNVLANSNSSYAGQYAACSVAPVTGLYVAVTPTQTLEDCAVYQLLAEETTGYGGYPSGVGTFLPADTTQVVLQGLLPAGTSTANIGPMGVGASSGQSISNLIECKVVTSDITSQTVNIVSSGGSVSTTSANRDRVDRITCQFKSSTSAVSPTTPTVDAGYVAIATVVVPFGTVTVTSGMVTAQTGQQLAQYVDLVSNQTVAGTKTFSSPLASSVVYGNNPLSALSYQFPSSSGTTACGASSGLAASGVTASVFGCGQTGSSNFISQDTSGNLGLTGSLHAAGAVFPSVNQNGILITPSGNSGVSDTQWSSTTTSTILGQFTVNSSTSGAFYSAASNSALGIIPPVYTAGGASASTTAHSVYGSCSFSTSTSCGPTTFTGAAVFSVSYACAVTATAASPNFWAQQSSLSGVTLEASASYTGPVTFVCTGT